MKKIEASFLNQRNAGVFYLSLFLFQLSSSNEDCFIVKLSKASLLGNLTLPFVT